MIKKFLVIVILAITPLAGCSHQTIHDYCSQNIEHYSNYEECYNETTIRRAHHKSVVAQFLKGMGDSMSNSTTCTGTTYGQYIQVSCN